MTTHFDFTPRNKAASDKVPSAADELKIKPEDREVIVQRHHAGETLTALALSYGVSRSYLCKVIAGNKTEPRKTTTPKPVYRDATRLPVPRCLCGRSADSCKCEEKMR